VIDDNIRFIHALRHKEIAPAKDERAELSSMAPKIRCEALEAARPILGELERIGGPAAEKALKNALENPDPDVRKAAIAAAQKTLFGREIVQELVKLLKDKSEEIKDEAYLSLAVAANWRFPEAQEALEQVARKKSGTQKERVQAIEALGKALKLDLLGNFEDKGVLWTIVLLLDDDDPKVRAAAFAQVEKGVKDTFGYSPELPAPERKVAVGKWKSWCEQKTAGSTAGVAGGKS